MGGLVMACLCVILTKSSVGASEVDTWDADSPPVCWVTVDGDGYETSIDLCTGHTFDCTPYVDDVGNDVCR